LTYHWQVALLILFTTGGLVLFIEIGNCIADLLDFIRSEKSEVQVEGKKSQGPPTAIPTSTSSCEMSAM